MAAAAANDAAAAAAVVALLMCPPLPSGDVDAIFFNPHVCLALVYASRSFTIAVLHIIRMYQISFSLQIPKLGCMIVVSVLAGSLCRHFCPADSMGYIITSKNSWFKVTRNLARRCIVYWGNLCDLCDLFDLCDMSGLD